MTDAIKTLDSGNVNIFAKSAENNEAVKTALFNKTHIPQAKVQSLFNESQKAAEELLAVLSDKAPRSSSLPLVNNGAPELREPKTPVGTDVKLSGSAMFIKLVGNLKVLLGDVSLAQLANRLEILQANSAALKQANEALAVRFQQAIDSSMAAIDSANTDVESLQIAQNLVVEKQQNYDQAKKLLDQLSPQDPEYAAALSQVESAQQDLTKATGQLTVAQTRANASYQVARDAAMAVDDLFNQMQGLVYAPAPAVKEQGEKSLGAMARMMLLIGTLTKLMGENSEKALKNDSAIFQLMQESEQRGLQKLSDKHAAESAKAEALNKAMGCIGKILGGLITLVSVVGALFTGGASLAFAAVGLALMVGDTIGKAITGVSFMEKALSPLMDSIIKPLVEALSKGIAKMLETLGVDPATANMIGSIVGTLVAAALIIAAVVVGKSAAGQVASTALGNMVKEALKDLLPAIMKTALTSTSAMLKNSVKPLLDRLKLASDKEAVTLYTNRLNTFSVSTGLGSEMIQAGGRVAQGMAEKNAQHILANFSLSQSVMEQIKQLIEQLVEKLGESQSERQRLMTIVSDSQTDAGQTQKTILRNSLA